MQPIDSLQPKQTVAADPPTHTVATFVRAVADAYGDKTLIVLGEERLSYRDAERRSSALARALVARGIGKGTHVGLLMPNGPDWVVAWLAAARMGAVVVPLNTFYKARELGWVLRHADVDTLLTVDRFLGNDYLARLEEFAPELARASSVPLHLASLPYLRRVYTWSRTAEDVPARAWTSAGGEGLQNDGQPVSEALLSALEAAVDPSDPMVLIYSSGSTADPKGALHSQAAPIRHAAILNRFRRIGADDRLYSPMPFFWVGGFVFVLLSAMQAGATILAEEAFEPGQTLAYLERERATIVAGWPHYGKAMAEHPSFAVRDLSSIHSGNIYAILPPRVRPADPELRPTALGMTETCGPHTIADMQTDLPEALRGSFGMSVPGLEHKIVDPTTGARLPNGSSGEICVRGYSVMLGLYKVDRESTFDEEGYYHTGDGGHFDQHGHLFFEGRLGDVIKTGGANVSPREVELVLEAIEDVKEAYVVGVPDPVRGQNVAAVLVPLAGRSLDEQVIRSAARAELSAYKVPRHLFFHRSEELPFTDTGKIDKRRLQAMLSKRLASAS